MSTAKMNTTHGTISLELFDEDAPKTVANFRKLAGEQFYDGMLVAIEEQRLVFRRQTRWTDGHTDVAVETKPLRQPSAADSLTEQKTASANDKTDAKHAASDPKAEVNAFVEALKALAAAANSQQQQQQSGPDSQGSQPNSKP